MFSISIIGGGVSGLFCAHVLRTHINSIGKSRAEVKIYQDSHSYYTLSSLDRVWVLWPPTYKILRNYLKKSILESITQKVSRVDIIDLVADAPLASYSLPHNNDYNTQKDYFYITSEMDLIRGILAELSGETKFTPEYDPENWFTSEDYEEKVPGLLLGKMLDSYSISAQTGKVTCVFQDENRIKTDTLIGADGQTSVVRSILANERHKDNFTNLRVFYGTAYPEATSCVHSKAPLPISYGLLKIQDAESSFGSDSLKTYIFDDISIQACVYKDRIMWKLVIPESLVKDKMVCITKMCPRDISESKWTINEKIRSIAERYNRKFNSSDTNDFFKITENFNVRSANNFEVESNRAEVLKLVALLSLDSNTSNHFQTLQKIILHTNVKNVFTERIMNDYIDPPEDAIAPNFHPGSVVLIGDAAFTLHLNNLGISGGNFGIISCNILARCLNDIAFSETEGLKPAALEYNKSVMELANKLVSYISRTLNLPVHNNGTVTKFMKNVTSFFYASVMGSHLALEEIIDILNAA